eukprot:6488576-Amphidinium_carterae.1
MAPTRGNLAIFVDSILEQESDEKLRHRQRWSVTLSSESHNMSGLFPQDRDALTQILGLSKDPLHDISSSAFFGGARCHPMTANFASFVGPCKKQEDLCSKHPEPCPSLEI